MNDRERHNYEQRIAEMQYEIEVIFESFFVIIFIHFIREKTWEFIL